MTDQPSGRRYRFGVFEADASTGELRRQGVRIKLNSQPFQLLLMLLERPGVLLTREEISRQLWPDGTFVDSEHGVNAAINRIRSAIGDMANNPRFVETLARRGYRFVAPVERFPAEALPSAINQHDSSQIPLSSAPAEVEAEGTSNPGIRILAAAEELPETSYALVHIIFVLLQFMYMGFYIGALANLAEIENLFAQLPKPVLLLNILIVTAALLIPARAFVLSAVLFRAPRAREQFLKLWQFLVPFDFLWSLAPFLLLHHINFGLALSCTALLVYSPFAQRSLILMGAAKARPEEPPDFKQTR